VQRDANSRTQESEVQMKRIDPEKFIKELFKIADETKAKAEAARDNPYTYSMFIAEYSALIYVGSAVSKAIVDDGTGK
jgi:hypothetical protein